MRSSSRVLLLITVTVLPLWAFPANTVNAEPQDKAQQPKAAADSQPSPPKLSTETKPLPQSSPPAKTDVVPDREMKEKEAARKPLGSLILTVKLALLADARLFHYEVDVEEDQQAIMLAGRVSSEEEKAAAAEVARSVPGIKAVVNKLEVDKGLTLALMKKRDDSITVLIKERFAKSATLKAANFDVKTENGIVSLTGSVRFQVIALEAAETARNVPGVRAVKTDQVRLEGDG